MPASPAAPHYPAHACALPHCRSGARCPDPARSSACAAAAPIAMHGPITRTLESAATSPSMQRPAARAATTPKYSPIAG